MTDFTIHTQETAPAASKPLLDKSHKAIGFVPGLLGVLAEAPKALEAYQVLGTLFTETSLTTTEQHVVWLTINYENDCGYCVPAHTALAKLDAVPDDVIEALRNGTSIADPKLEALRTFTVQVVDKRGWVTDDDVQAFLNAGYTRQQILEVILGLAHKVISNYTNHLAETPVDAVFKKFAWQKPQAAEAA
jgi:AhpD family alkylhydroperoxidase